MGPNSKPPWARSARKAQKSWAGFQKQLAKLISALAARDTATWTALVPKIEATLAEVTDHVREIPVEGRETCLADLDRLRASFRDGVMPQPGEFARIAGWLESLAVN